LVCLENDGSGIQMAGIWIPFTLNQRLISKKTFFSVYIGQNFDNKTDLNSPQISTIKLGKKVTNFLERKEC
jgi:hypothetical protein